MTKVHIIGKGYFGKKIEKTIKDMVTFVEPDQSDWIIISTPNDLHYEQVKFWLRKNKNVFCEKPLCLSEKAAVELYNIAEENKVLLYVDDVFRHQKYDDKDSINSVSTYNSFKWHKWGSFKANIIDNLAYHHFYMSEFCYEDFEKKDIIVQKRSFDYNGVAKFNLAINGKICDYDYKIDEYNFPFIHTFNNCNVKPKNNPLKDMFSKIFNNDTKEFEINKKISVNAIKISEVVKEKLFDNILVVGGGVFGTTAATILSCSGFNVTLHEKNEEVISSASFINQYRLHRGYHYPRSKKTAEECLVGLKSFKRKYESTIVNGNIEHYYAIASRDTLTKPKDYIDFLQDLGLTFQIVKPLKGTDLTVKVEEELFDMLALRKSVENKIFGTNVKLHTNRETIRHDFDDYDFIVNATYSNINQFKKTKEVYQYEVCEKPVVLLPEQYKNKSIVVMDGPFMCLDPFGNTEYHVLGHVEHAIHSRNIGKEANIPNKLKDYLNSGIVKPKVTNIELFRQAGLEFFDEFDKLKHIGSMFTVRTVLANRDYDDARPTLVEHNEDNVFSMFSGKIDTCVEASNQLIKKMKGERYV